MEVIVYIASRVWCFFSLLGKVGMLPIGVVLDNYYVLRADNPFNDFALEVDVGVGGSIITDILDIITTITGSQDLTVFEGMLFSFVALFVINLFARLISFATPD